jgi:hypothetical protein
MSAVCAGKNKIFRKEQALGQDRTVTSGAQRRASSRRAQPAMETGSLIPILGE